MEGYEYAMAEGKQQDGARVKTMSPLIHEESNLGVAVRTIKEFYKQRSKIKDELRDRFFFYVSFFQIYNEMVFDLLNFDYSQSGESGVGGRRYLSK